MNETKTSLIITSIASPNEALKAFALEAKNHGIDFIVIGDTKSPPDFKLENCRFFSISEQEKLDLKIAKILPKKHYSRKNIGYLLSAQSDIIIESDDDNFPKEDFWNKRSIKVKAKTVEDEGWVNIYRSFSNSTIWPRGFPLELISTSTPHLENDPTELICPIQQGLADDNPDVDAVFRMCRELPVKFDKRLPVAVGKNSWCPFNSQNTTWFKEAFPLLYLPSFCSFRMTDIWRSFIAQRIGWTCGWSVLFHNATVWQERNEHSLLKDFEDEIPGYLNNSTICRQLEEINLENGIENIYENLFRCYSMMVEKNFIGKDELPLVEAWISDLRV
ncbi:MAG: STELLO glycosyltransferase family protein [bacterium]